MGARRRCRVACQFKFVLCELMSGGAPFGVEVDELMGFMYAGGAGIWAEACERVCVETEVNGTETRCEDLAAIRNRIPTMK